MKLKVAVLFGGKSTEHEISIISAIQAMQSLDRNKYDVVPVYMTKDAEFYTGEGIDGAVRVHLPGLDAGDRGSHRRCDLHGCVCRDGA